jgi:hypothetical protein
MDRVAIKVNRSTGQPRQVWRVDRDNVRQVNRAEERGFVVEPEMVSDLSGSGFRHSSPRDPVPPSAPVFPFPFVQESNMQSVTKLTTKLLSPNYVTVPG